MLQSQYHTALLQGFVFNDNERGRIRTCDQRIRNPWLYPLSYAPTTILWLQKESSIQLYRFPYQEAIENCRFPGRKAKMLVAG